MNPFMWLYRDRASPFYSPIGVTENERPVLAKKVAEVFRGAGFRVETNYLSNLHYRYVASSRVRWLLPIYNVLDSTLFTPRFMRALRAFVLTSGAKLLNFAKPQSQTRALTAETADLTIVGGAGHVGIPLVLSFAAKGMSVNVNDLNQEALAALQSGKVPFMEAGAEPLLAKALSDKLLFFTSEPSAISRKGPVIVTIGTPVDEFLNPVREAVRDCIDSLLPSMRDGQLLVLRSTLYPGSTELDRSPHQEQRPRHQGRVLPRAHRARQRYRGTCDHAPASQRHLARGGKRSGGVVRYDRAEASETEPDGSGVCEAV